MRINVLRTLALSLALILALVGISGASEEDTSDTGERVSVEASPPAAATEEATDETSEPASVEASPPAAATEEATDETSSENLDTEASEAEEE